MVRYVFPPSYVLEMTDSSKPDRSLITVGDLVVVNKHGRAELGLPRGIGMVLRRNTRDIVYVSWGNLKGKPKPVNVRWLEYAK